MKSEIRFARQEDAKALAELYRYYVERTAVSFEYDPPTVPEFVRRMETTQRRYPYLVAETDGRPVGFAYAGPFAERAAYAWSAETTIYLAQEATGQGIGRGLYEALEDALGAMGVLNLNACIAVPEQEDAYLTDNSMNFHAHMGYALVGRFHHSGYKFGRWYDMVWMEKLLGPHPDRPTPVKNINEVRTELESRWD